MGNNFKDNAILSTDGKDEQGFRGTGLFPVTYGELPHSEYSSNEAEEYSWFRRKLFHEHFVEIKGEDYYLVIDPLINASLGKEEGSVNTSMFQNTRAFQVTGKVMDNISFYTGFYENQARFASFQTEYFASRGERRLNNANEYQVINAVIPGGGRTKPFKEGAFDYASSASYIRYRMNKNIAFQFGNTPNFIGWGHRSMLLSDNSFNATTLRIDATINDKWNYTTLNSKHLNLFRRKYSTNFEKPFEKKNFSAHYLTYQPTEKLTIGLFESQVFFREDSVFSQWMHPLYFNPIPLMNTAVFGWENEHAKSLLGLNFAWNVAKRHLIYGQVITDDLGRNKEFGFQIGWRSSDLLGVKNLQLQVEYNKASEQLYAAHNNRMSYTHFNLPLAHTLGNGFDEGVVRLNYMFKKVYFQSHNVFYITDQPISEASNLYGGKELSTELNVQQVLFTAFEVGYQFNPRTDLRIFSKIVNRSSLIAGEQSSQQLVYFGIKTGLFNQHMDF